MTSTSPTSRQGADAERRAGEYLERQGLAIVARNLRCRAGELDLVCLDGGILVIVEVRQRARLDFGGAIASVTGAKRARLVRATQFHWQRRIDWQGRRLRFDVIALQGRAGAVEQIIWIKDAFRAG